MRVFKKKYYILKSHPGNKLEYRVCTGFKATNNKLSIVKEFRENGRGKFRLEDGHVPEYQPIVKEKEIIPWLDIEKYQTAYILNPEVYGLSVKSAHGQGLNCPEEV